MNTDQSLFLAFAIVLCTLIVTIGANDAFTDYQSEVTNRYDYCNTPEEVTSARD